MIFFQQKETCLQMAHLIHVKNYTRFVIKQEQRKTENKLFCSTNVKSK